MMTHEGIANLVGHQQEGFEFLWKYVQPGDRVPHLLALFGAPVSDGRDADHAIAAALEMKAAIGSINDYFSGEIVKPLAIGISIHTGEAVVGNIGFEKKMDYTVIGDAVNVVFSLQDLTRIIPNGIVVSEKTLRALSKARPKVREMGSCDAGQGLEELKTYELMGLKP